MTLGLLYRMPGSGEPIVGMQVAVDAFVGALDRHGTMETRIFAAERMLGAIQQRLRPERVQITDARALADTPLAAWHELAFDAQRPFAVRRSLRASFPITITHHTLSYRELAHDVFLRLVLEGPAPYDSILCSSTASRAAVEKLLAHTADAIHRSHGTRLSYRGRLDVVPLGVDTDRFRPRDRGDARARCGLPDDVFLLLWVGRLSSIDKADLLPFVRVFADVVRAHPEKKLLLMCVGGERPGEELGRVVTEYAHQLGIGANVLVGNEVPPGGAHLVHACADVFISLVDNIQETFGLTPVEAMACGVPQLVSDWNGYRDTVVDGETGFRIPTTWAPCDDDLAAFSPFHEPADDHLILAQSVAIDLAVLRDRLTELIVNDDLRRSMGERSRARAEQHYAIRNVVAQHEALWKELRAHAAAEPLASHPPSVDDVPYHAIFGHYATRTLSDEDAIELTDEGRALIAGKVVVRFSLRWPGLHDVDLYKRVLAALPCRVRDLPRDPRVTRAVLWLLKYGFVR